MHAVTGCTAQCALFLIGFITNSEGKEKQNGKVPKLFMWVSSIFTKCYIIFNKTNELTNFNNK